MVLSASLTTKLLGAIETNSLIFLCGAGLSAAPPSNLLPATEVSKICYGKWRAIEVLDPALEERLDQLAGYFHAKGDFEDVFIGLVPWDELVGQPNTGHAAIADFLISRAAHGALSTNFDTMIESWAGQHKVAMRGALTGHEAVDFMDCSNPLIKFHGCLHRGREKTFWTQGQFNDAAIQTRIASCIGWINLNLPNKHLVVVGFWTDWGHMNDALADALTIGNAGSVTVIDPKPTAALAAAAPNLWARLNGLSHAFEHVEASGADALEELRTEYSKVWARRFYALGKALVEGAGGAAAVPAPFDGLAGQDLYNLRRDAQAVPYTRAATLKTPAAGAAQAASIYVLLLNAGATTQGAWLRHGGQSIRVVNGAGQGLRQVEAQYKEPTTIAQPEIVVCAGAVNLGVPARVVASGRGASTVRPAPGGGAKWLTFEEALAELGL